jgi:kynurenine formamidase
VGVFFTRGVLLDIASLKGKTCLEGGYEITVQDLQDALAKQEVEIGKGGVVLIHTGWGTLWGVDNEKYAREEPGLGVAAAEFLVGKEVVLVVADNFGVEAVPHAIPDAAFPVHQIFLTLNGIYLLENLDLSEMVRDKVYEFAFFFAPLRLKGATGSPGNPVAIH